MDRFGWFGHQNRGLLLRAQPFFHTELGPAKLYVIGSLNCALTYMNTIEENTTWKEGVQLSFFHKSDKDVILEPKCALNCIFEEVRSMNYNEKGRTFTSWEAFVEWVFSGPTDGVLTSSVQHAEEVYACYTKEYPWAHPKIKSRK